MTRLIWVRYNPGWAVLINPALIRRAEPSSAIREGRSVPGLSVWFGPDDEHWFMDPDGNLLHLLTDGVPEPPKPPEAS